MAPEPGGAAHFSGWPDDQEQLPGQGDEHQGQAQIRAVGQEPVNSSGIMMKRCMGIRLLLVAIPGAAKRRNGSWSWETRGGMTAAEL